MLERSRYLSEFVDLMSRINRGRAFYVEPEHLGEYVLVDYVNKKTKRVAWPPLPPPPGQPLAEPDLICDRTARAGQIAPEPLVAPPLLHPLTRRTGQTA